MGEIRSYSCSCGYNQEIFLGGGLQSCSIPAIKKHFAPDTISEFIAQQDSGNVESYIMENILAECPDCTSLFTVPGFTYKTNDNISHSFINSCPKCRKMPVIVEDTSQVVCPKCGQIMQFISTGNWD